MCSVGSDPLSSVGYGPEACELAGASDRPWNVASSWEARRAASWQSRATATGLAVTPMTTQAAPRTGRRVFRDRRDAGRVLARMLEGYRGRDDVVVLALPRGGVPVAYEVATALGAPLDVFVVRKLGVPGHEEVAMGAIASGGVAVLNDDVIRGLGISPEAV
jgi:hypothetical protein